MSPWPVIVIIGGRDLFGVISRRDLYNSNLCPTILNPTFEVISSWTGARQAQYYGHATIIHPAFNVISSWSKIENFTADCDQFCADLDDREKKEVMIVLGVMLAIFPL